MAIKKGDKAPSFTLFNTDRKEVSLEDYRGKSLIIHFFPLAFTGTCTTQLCTMRDNLSIYQNLNAEVIGISVDSPFALARYKADQNYNFDLLSDFNREASQAYGAYYDEFMLGLKGISKRAAFVVDEEGIVKYAEILDNAGELPDFGALTDTLEAM